MPEILQQKLKRNVIEELTNKYEDCVEVENPYVHYIGKGVTMAESNVKE